MHDLRHAPKGGRQHLWPGDVGLHDVHVQPGERRAVLSGQNHGTNALFALLPAFQQMPDKNIAQMSRRTRDQ